MSVFSPVTTTTLFARILWTIALVSVAFHVFILAVLGSLLLVPVGQRSADDLTALMMVAARQWEVLPSAGREGLARQFAEEHGLRLMAGNDRPLPSSDNWLPYLYFVEEKLRQRLGHEVQLMVEEDARHEEWYWADIPLAQGESVRVGFSRSRIGVHPPFALFLVLSVGSLVILATAAVMAHRISRPLERLAGAARRIGSGQWPEPIPEQGPEELASLARSFNRMSLQVQELLANRTTLLAGISHDLRTPLARLQLALAMLPQDAEADLIAGMQRDLEEMNHLIGQFLEISRGLGEGRKEMVDVGAAIAELGGNARRGGAQVVWQEHGTCRRELHRLALCRIVSNLLDNAVRYGDGSPIELDYVCDASGLVIRVMDRGPGIPEDQREAVFRPFHRLEQSRSTQTGGSGLGLAIARQLALANGWRIYLLSREGGGTVAEVQLPATGGA